MTFPTKDDITQKLVENLVGSGKTISDLSNQWVVKHIIIGLREAIYLLVVVLKLVYDQLTVTGASGEKLQELGYEYGVDKKGATAAVHRVTLNKSSPVSADTPVPDSFLVTTTPNGSNAPVQFRVQADQSAYIPSGQTSVNVLVQCTVTGEVGNVPSGAINLIAQAGFDSVTNSILVTAGTEAEDDETYRSRILERKRNPGRGGTKADWKIWAESVTGVVSALVIPKNRGRGTVDIVITGINGIPDAALVQECQSYLDTLTPADMADGGVLVLAPTPIAIDVTISGGVWAAGYSASTAASFVSDAIKTYISQQANTDRVVRWLDIITAAKGAYDPADSNKSPVLLDFTLASPTTNHALGSIEMAVPGTISIT